MTVFRFKRIDEVMPVSTLPPNILAHIAEKTNETAHRESLAAYSLLSETATEIEAPTLLSDILFAESGKPLVGSGERYVSLSHSGAYVAVALSDMPIGIDLQRVESSRSSERLAARFFCKEEADEILSLPEAERPYAFTRLFAEKEAVAKLRDLPLAVIAKIPRKEMHESILCRRIHDGDEDYLVAVASL